MPQTPGLFLSLLLVLPTIFSQIAGATLAQPGDVTYSVWPNGPTRYIYDAEVREFVDQLASYHQSFRRLYDQSFSWALNEQQDLILLSPRTQVANAWATNFPNLKSLWFPSGAGDIQHYAGSSWLLLLDSHETSHLYQLSAQSRVGRSIKSVLGNTTMFFPFLWPVFPQPNYILPVSILEGNAVLNESRVHLGGRLFSGEKRALVLAQIAAGDIDATRLINDEFKFPFGDNNYLQGGYFQAHLAAKYGIEKVNSFFMAQAEHYLNPLILNKTFRDHFGASYYEEVHEYLHEMQPAAREQKFAQGESQIDMLFSGEMNHDDHRIWWVGTNGVEPVYLNQLDKATGEIHSKQMDIAIGKVFFAADGETPLTANTDQHNLHFQEYSLYGEHRRFESLYQGQIVTDQRAGKTVALDAAHSWRDGHILLNGQTYDIAHSSPIFDEQGGVYYFRQDGKQRILFKNRQPVFKYEGYYGKLTEVTEDGSIYFIANSEFGSTLYRYRKGEITRQVESDRVIDARHVRGDQFLLMETEPEGSRAILAQAKSVHQTPAVYNYPFVTEEVTPDKPVGANVVREHEHTYNAFRDLRYSSLDAALYAGSDGLATSLLASFNDPLQFHAIQLGYSSTFSHYQETLAEYDFTKILPNFYAQYWNRRDDWYRQDGGKQPSQDAQFTLGARSPILRWRDWDANVDVGLYYKDGDRQHDQLTLLDNGTRELTYGALSKFNLRWAIPTAIGFYNWREFDFGFANRLDTLPGTWRKNRNTNQISAQYIYGFPDQYYLTAFGSYAWAETPDVEVRYNQYALIKDLQVDRLTSHGEYNTKQAGAARLEFTKAVITSLYSSRIPVALQRIAPLVVGQEILMDRDPYRYYPRQLFEWGVGADFELLLFHKATARLRLIETYDTRDPRYKETQANLNFKSDF